jgi:hypothetical protein
MAMSNHLLPTMQGYRLAILVGAVAGLPDPGSSDYGDTGNRLAEEKDELMSGSGEGELRAPSWHKDGPLPTISDSLFSLIILIYVSVIFIFMFFSFCWKEPEPPPPDPHAVKPPMITEILKAEEEEAMARVAAAANNLADELMSDRKKKKAGGGDSSNPSNGGASLVKRKSVIEEEDEEEEEAERHEMQVLDPSSNV